MAKFAAVTALAGAAFAGDVALSWTDCGDASTHGKISDVEPKTLTLGTTTTVTGTGSTDEAVSAGSFSASITAGGGLVHDTWKGDLCSASTHSLPLGLGEISFKGMSCPVAAGAASLALDVTLSASIPTSLASADIQLNGAATSGDKLICVKIHTQQALDYDTEWKAYKEKFGKVYNGDEADRFAVFKSNLDFIEAENAKNVDVTLGVTEFADLTPAEFKAMYLNGLQGEPSHQDAAHLGKHVYSGAKLPDSVDWSQQGAVSPVKNQGQCGSCWAFSTVGSLEGRHQITTGKLQQFSEQQYVDCDKAFGDQGCNGGLMDNAFKYAMQADICTEESYTYTGKGGNCQASSCSVGLTKGSVTGYKDVDKTEEALQEAVASGPVSVAVDAATIFQLYMGGIMNLPCGSTLDHGVLAVGYGVENGKKYWKVKNSWGSSWGEHGYLRMLKGKSGAGQCGIRQQASYPVVAASINV